MTPRSFAGVGALYLHVPFCVRRCRYCDFSTAATRHDDPLMAAYASSLENLIEEALELGLLAECQTAYLGGGTPTMLGAKNLSSLVSAVRSASSVRELSFEANPESLTDEVLDATVASGATRVSIGVQSFDDLELRGLGRVHTAGLASDRVAAAVASGLDVSLDLMCGIPFQTPESWHKSLARAVELGVGHVSCYPLMIEPGTPLERMCESGEVPWPSDDTEADDMETAFDVLESAGYSRYEVASYAQPGKRCQHNIAYWTGISYLGLGVSAASMLSLPEYEALQTVVSSLPAPSDGAWRFRLTSSDDVRAYARVRSLAELSFEVEQMTETEAVAEDLMLAARMTDGIPAALQARARHVLGEDRVGECFSALIGNGFLVAADCGSLVPTKKGWLLGNELYGPLWNLASEG